MTKYFFEMMKTKTLTLYLPVIAMTAQQTAAGLVMSPYLDSLGYPLSAIGYLISLSPFMALAARLPAGLLYRGERARLLMAVALTVIALCNIAYGYLTSPIPFALVHATNGFAFSSVTTIYLAFFVESLPAETDRIHAMGYYSGCLAIGYSSGGFAAGYISDHWGYIASFRFAAVLALFALTMLLYLTQAPSRRVSHSPTHMHGSLSLLQPLKSLAMFLNPKMATIVVVALFVNLVHQMGTAFFPLYGLSVGLSMTEVGMVRGLYALCNAVTRPLSGLVVKRLGRQRLSYSGIPMESLMMMLVPFFSDIGSLSVIFVIAGLLRAVVIVANAVSVVEDVDETRIGRGMASGIYQAAGDLGNILGPSVGGVIASFTGIAQLFFVAPPLIAAVFFVSLWGNRFLGERTAQEQN